MFQGDRLGFTVQINRTRTREGELMIDLDFELVCERELYLRRCKSLVALFSENLKFGVDVFGESLEGLITREREIEM